jgi:ABC-type lipoprotein release transport system permease subunit
VRIPFKDLLAIFLEGRSTGYFLFFAIFALSASMAIVICNIGLMDGYDSALKKVLRTGQGDITIFSQNGFFAPAEVSFRDPSLTKEIRASVGFIQSEAFVVKDEQAQGVMVKAVKLGDLPYFHLRPWKPRSILIGQDLGQELELKLGDQVALAFAQGNANDKGLPNLTAYEVGGFYKTGLYRYDSRVIYIYENDYKMDQDVRSERINKIHYLLNSDDDSPGYINKIVQKMKRNISPQFSVRPYWSDYQSLFEAVQVEKKSISLVLQLIIIMALFNIVAFVYYLTDKKGTEFFILRALGLSGKGLFSFLVQMIILFWLVSCFGSLLFALFFNQVILRLPWLQIPGKIYELGQLSLSLSSGVVLQVFLVSFIWVFIVSYWSLLRLRRKSLVAGLREEFGT